MGSWIWLCLKADLCQGSRFTSALSWLLLCCLSRATTRNWVGTSGPPLAIHPRPRSIFSSICGLMLFATGATAVGKAWLGPERDHQPAGPSLPTALWGLTLTTLSTLMGEFRKQFSLRNEQIVSTALFTWARNWRLGWRNSLMNLSRSPAGVW